MAVTSLSTVGMTWSSRASAKGSGTHSAASRRTGASSISYPSSADPMSPPQNDSAIRNLLVHRNDVKAVQKIARRSFDIAIGPNHYFHPGDDTDRLLRVALKFSARLGNSIEVIDQNVCVE